MGHFANTEINKVLENYTVVRLDALSSDPIVDVEGNKTTPKAYAEKLGISYKHLNSVCKQQISKTAKDFIIDNTILEIKRQQALGLSTNQVSRKLGFDEHTNFVKFRKKHLV